MSQRQHSLLSGTGSAEARGYVPAISSRIRNILASGALSDIELAVGRDHGEVKIFAAHKLILGISSDVFYTTFYGDSAERGDIINIPDIPPEAFFNMLSYIYTDTMTSLTPENVVPTLYCAIKYELPWLEEYCKQFVREQLSAHNCLLILENVLKWSPHCDRFLEDCLDVIDEFSKTVFLSENFSAIGKNTLFTILQRSTLSAEENTVYEAVEKWATAACMRNRSLPSAFNRRKVLGEAFSLVRFPLMTDEQLANGPVKSGLLSATEMCGIFMWRNKATEKPLDFNTQPRTYAAEVCPIGDEAFYNLREKIFMLCVSGFWLPAIVTGNYRVDMELSGFTDTAVPEKAVPEETVRAVDILQHGLPVLVRVDKSIQSALQSLSSSGKVSNHPDSQFQ
ncbi:BTB/POZ domain-containing protein 3-like isoform X2 [Paramacrobiotus metropolitanus]|uniref:BTB/POZ domain-containing protein 3-like isoform X2 n=1 Tax=Paramacrobiotus metropolitanus TaxID=2943436 RepID=UPI0024460356|nr:BTB/POZ domain-containing protein 3-like isoform X2 [Paramacrobiotus metropolitanus]